MTESGRAFGMEAEGESNPLEDILAEEEQTPEPEPETTPEEPPAAPEASPEPAPEATPEPASDDSDTESEPESEPTKLWAGRFDSPEKLEESYKEAQRWGTREAQRRAALEKELNDFKTRVEPLLPHLQKLSQPVPQPLTDEVGDLDPAKVQAQIEQVRQEAYQAAQQQAHALLAQQQQAAAQERAVQAIKAFEAEHPGINGTPVVEDMRRLFEEYRQDDPEFLPTSKENLDVVHTLASDPRVKGMLDSLNLFPDPEYVEVAKELVERPELVPIVMAHPHVVETPRGMDWARSQIQAAAPPNTTQPTQRSEENKKRAFVEKGGTGAPVNAAPAADSWLAEIMAVEDRDAPVSKTLGI